jgi:NAD(P)-dependent dehydrogenase (short-subunit alcohol dehydrogenase family)
MKETALVTGAGTGVGRAVALALAGVGMRVAVLGRRPGPLDETAEMIRGAGGEAMVILGDTSDTEGMRIAVEQIAEQWSPVGVLINNAGVHGGFARILESDPESWGRSLSTNVYGPYLLCRLCAPAMRERGRGFLINVSSAAGLAEPHAQSSDYVLSKVALNYLTRQIAHDLDGSGVLCCAIHPGEVKTEMWQAIKSDALSRGAAGAGALGWAEMVERTGGDPPEKAAELVLRLLGSTPEQVHGKFHWIEGGIQPPRATW